MTPQTRSVAVTCGMTAIDQSFGALTLRTHHRQMQSMPSMLSLFKAVNGLGMPELKELPETCEFRSKVRMKGLQLRVHQPPTLHRSTVHGGYSMDSMSPLPNNRKEQQ